MTKHTECRIATMEIEIPFELTIDPCTGDDARNPHCGPDTDYVIRGPIIHSLNSKTSYPITGDLRKALMDILEEEVEREIFGDQRKAKGETKMDKKLDTGEVILSAGYRQYLLPNASGRADELMHLLGGALLVEEDHTNECFRQKERERGDAKPRLLIVAPSEVKLGIDRDKQPVEPKAADCQEAVHYEAS